MLRRRTVIARCGALALALGGCAAEYGVEEVDTEGAALTSASAYRAGLDPTFDGDGRVHTPLPFRSAQSTAFAVAVRNYQLVFAGNALASDGTWSFALARHRRDGSLDPTFGLFGQTTGAFRGPSSGTAAHAVAIQPDGRILAGGRVTRTGASPCYALARFDDRGALDTAFGPQRNGTTTTCFTAGTGIAGARAMAIDSGQRIFLAGEAPASGGVTPGLVRYDTLGVLDPAFGSGGRARGGHVGMIADAIALRPDGRILVAGFIRADGGCTGCNEFAVEQYLPTGDIDPAFGDGGLRRIRFFGGLLGATSSAHALALQSDGAVVVAGEASYAGSVPNPARHGALARLTEDGELDESFGDSGLVTTNLGGFQGTWRAMIALPDDSLIVAGHHTPPGGGGQSALAHYFPDGDIDLQWDDVLARGDGVLLTPFFGNGAQSCFATHAMARDTPLIIGPPSSRDAVTVVGRCGSRMAAMRFSFEPPFSPF